MTTNRTAHPLAAWLGPALGDLTDDQLDEVTRASRDIDTRYPDPDDSDLRDAALSAEVQMILGETTPEEAATLLANARRAALVASAAAQQIAVRLVRNGMTKQDAARTAGISRPTLDEALLVTHHRRGN